MNAPPSPHLEPFVRRTLLPPLHASTPTRADSNNTPLQSNHYEALSEATTGQSGNMADASRENLAPAPTSTTDAVVTASSSKTSPVG